MVREEHLLDIEVRQEQLMVKALEQSVLVDKILMDIAHKSALSRAEGQVLQRAASAFNQLVGALGAIFHPQGKALFNYTVKFHIMEHIALDSSELHPLLSSTFASEDFLQKVRDLVQHSSHGSSPVHIQNEVMNKFLRGLAMSLWPDNPLK